MEILNLNFLPCITTIPPGGLDINYLILTFGIAHYGVIRNMGYTHICNLIGNRIIFRFYLKSINKNNLYKKDKYLDYLNINESYHNFLKFLNLDKYSYITLGSYFLDILCRFPSEIFEKGYDDNFNFNKYETMKLKFNNS